MEARWAVFLDAMHQPWLYEPRGFDLEGELYRPDFWLPAQQCWIEVKPDWEFVEPHKLELLAEDANQNVYAALGKPAWPYDIPLGQFIRFSPTGTRVSNYRWTNCEQCGAAGLTLHGSLAGLAHRCSVEYDHRGNTARIVTATVMALMANFRWEEE